MARTTARLHFDRDEPRRVTALGAPRLRVVETNEGTRHDAARDPELAVIGVLLCGGERLVRAAIHALIDGRKTHRVLAEVQDVGELTTAAAQLQPGIIVVDLTSPLPDDPEVLRALRASVPNARVIAVAPTGDPEWHRRAMRLGAARLVTKQDGADAFFDAITATGPSAPAATTWKGSDIGMSVLHDILSKRELDVARLVCQGLRNEQIGRALFISEATVRHHLTTIFAKRGVGSRTELIVDAHQNAFLA